jgi:pimeloyl-ACP methyl ester carboxylesterase
MGGAITIVFTDRHPGLVRKLCLIGPAGLPFKRPFAAKLLEAPILGEWIMSLFGDRILVPGLKDDAYEPEKFPEYVEQYRTQMQYVGFKRALLSTIRSGSLAGATEAYAGVGRQGRPVMLIWGRKDQVVPFELSEQLRELIPHVEFHAIDEAGHVPHYERPELVNPLLITFLAK